MSHEEIIEGLFNETMAGNGPRVIELTNQGLAEGLTPSQILFDALIPSLEEVGARFERGDYFVPEMLIAGKAMSGALDILRPLLADTGAESVALTCGIASHAWLAMSMIHTGGVEPPRL